MKIHSVEVLYFNSDRFSVYPKLDFRGSRGFSFGQLSRSQLFGVKTIDLRNTGKSFTLHYYNSPKVSILFTLNLQLKVFNYFQNQLKAKDFSICFIQ